MTGENEPGGQSDTVAMATGGNNLVSEGETSVKL